MLRQLARTLAVPFVFLASLDQATLTADPCEVASIVKSSETGIKIHSPDGQWYLANKKGMSSFPYRDKPGSYKILGLKTDFMLIDADGKNLQQITHFNTPGYPEYYKDGACPAVGIWHEDGKTIDALVLLAGKHFPDYDIWTITFKGNCGNSRWKER